MYSICISNKISLFAHSIEYPHTNIIIPITLINMQFQHQRSKQWSQRSKINKLQPTSKILISAIVAIIGFTVTHGQPKKAISLQGFSYKDTTVQQIFQTTIAVQRKRFIKRIFSEINGLWSYIPFANQDKWADLQITLTTRIGFDIKQSENAIAGITSEGKIRVDVFQPIVLGKHWQTKIVDSSDGLFFKWDIKQFKEKQAELLQALATEQSLLLLDSFRHDPNKMSQLAYRLDQKLLMNKAVNYSPLLWLNRVNKMITSKLSQFSDSFTHNSSKKDRGQEEKQNRGKQSYRSADAKTGQSGRSNRRVSAYKYIGFSQEQDRIRRQLKKKLNL